MDDLKKHYSLIKLFLGADPTSMESKHKTTGTKVQLNDDDGNYDGGGENGDSDYSYSKDNTRDNYSYTEQDNNGDDIGDGHTDDSDVLCAFCDDGGKLLSCIGQCKRSFHPRKKDGSESKCKTLGYTSAQLKGIGSYICKNCEYKQHQCFKCGRLEPSDEPNARVFKCKSPSCGHFYHPKCVAKLLEPDNSDDDETCELEKRIMAGMPFTCPLHWCFECGKMEDRTQRALQFAVCRRCPKSYHRECLPRGISFETKVKHVEQRAWELSKIIMIYCLDHRICKATGNAKRDHIKFPNIPNISKVRYHHKKKVKMIGKRKRSVSQCSTKSNKVLSQLRSKKNKLTQRAAADKSFEHMILKPEGLAMSLKEDLQIEPSVVGAAGLSVLEDLKGQGKQLGNSSSFVVSTRMPSCAVSSKPENRRTSRPLKQTSLLTSCDTGKKCVVPSEGMLDHSVKDILLEKPDLDMDAGLDNEICRIAENKDGNEEEKSSEQYSGKGGATKKVTSHEEQNDVPRKVFVNKHAEGSGSKSESKKQRGMVWEENADGRNSISGQEEDIYGRENQSCERPCEHDSRSDKGMIAMNDGNKSGTGNVGVTPDHVDHNPPEKQPIARHVDRMTDEIDAQPDYCCDEDREMLNWGYACQEEPKSSECNGKPNAINNKKRKRRRRREFKGKTTDGNNEDLDKERKSNYIEDGKEARFGDSSHQYPSNLKEPDYLDDNRNNGHSNLPCGDKNRVAETSEYKTRLGTELSRREDLTHSTKANSSNSPMIGNTEGKRSYYDMYGQHPGTNNQYEYEARWHVTFSNNDNYYSRQWGSMQSAFPPADFGAGRWHDPRSYPRQPEHGTTGWRSPPFYPRSPGCFTGRWHSPPLYARTPEHAYHTMHLNNLPNLKYDEYSNFNHGGYHALGNDPAASYSPQVNNHGTYQPHIDVSVRGHGAAYGGRSCEYGVRSNYVFGWGPRTPAAGSVTDRYAANLEQTNYQPRRF